MYSNQLAVRVLLIENDSHEAQQVERALSSRVRGPLMMHIAEGLAEGLKLLKKYAFDLVVINGYVQSNKARAVLSAVRRSCSDVPTILLVRNEQGEVTIGAVQRGGEGHQVEGHFPPAALEKAIDSLVGTTLEPRRRLAA